MARTGLAPSSSPLSFSPRHSPTAAQLSPVTGASDGRLPAQWRLLEQTQPSKTHPLRPRPLLAQKHLHRPPRRNGPDCRSPYGTLPPRTPVRSPLRTRRMEHRISILRPQLPVGSPYRHRHRRNCRYRPGRRRLRRRRRLGRLLRLDAPAREHSLGPSHARHEADNRNHHQVLRPSSRPLRRHLRSHQQQEGPSRPSQPRDALRCESWLTRSAFTGGRSSRQVGSR